MRSQRAQGCWLQPCRVRAPGELRPLGSQAIQGGHVLHFRRLGERRDERRRDERQRDERWAARRGPPHGGVQVPPRSSPDGSTAPTHWSSPLLVPPPPPSIASPPPAPAARARYALRANNRTSAPRNSYERRPPAPTAAPPQQRSPHLTNSPPRPVHAAFAAVATADARAPSTRRR